MCVHVPSGLRRAITMHFAENSLPLVSLPYLLFDNDIVVFLLSRVNLYALALICRVLR
jgi:hypothetical protein